MRKLGLRAAAGALAAMFVFSAVIPAPSVLAAEDVFTTVLARENTLVITADMVDDDDEIVISGEKWDRVVVKKEAAAKDIYLDEVEIGELVVESGNKATVQLWKTDINRLTVSEPELEELKVSDLLPHLTNRETQQAIMDLYFKVQNNNALLRCYTPQIVTKEEAKVGEVVVSANAELDFAEGKVGAVALVAGSQVVRPEVTLKNYDGTVTYQGGESFHSVKLKLVDSELSTLTVNESSAKNYLTVSGKSSEIGKAKVSGNAQVLFDTPMGTIEVADTASAAKVAVHKEADALKVDASNAAIEIANGGRVTTANIFGENVKIEGNGKLSKAVILSKDAYIATEGTKIDGNNTYVKPVYVAPERPKVEIKDVNVIAGDGTEVEKNANGSATISFPGATNPDAPWKAAWIAVPSNVDINRISSVTVNITTSHQFGIKLLGANGEKYVDEYPGYNIAPNTTADYKYVVNPAKEKVAKIEFVCLVANQKPLTINSVIFELLDEAPEEEPKEERPLVYENKVYTFADLIKEWANVEYSVNEKGAMEVSFTGQYQSAIFKLPEVLNATDYPELRVKFSSPDGVAGKVWKVGEQADNPVITEYGLTGTAGKIGMEKIAGEDFDKIAFMAMGTSAYNAIFESVTFIGSGNIGKDDDNQGGTEGDNQEGNIPGTGEEQQVTVTISKPEKTTLTLDDTLTLTAKVAEGNIVTWSSSNQKIATVDENGVVTPVAAGTVTITALCGEAKDTVDLTVEKAFYYKSWNDAANKAVSTKDVAFDVTTESKPWGQIVAGINPVYGLKSDFAAMLPSSLAGTDLSTVDAVKENVSKFVFTVKVTSCTSDTATLQGAVQSGADYNYAGVFSAPVSIGVASQTEPAIINIEIPIEDTSALQEIAQTDVTVQDSVVGTKVTGTCTMKVVLK